MTTLVALGDSFTEGLEDDLGPTGRHLGWADRVAAALATRDGGLRYANLAVRGRLLDQVVADQVPLAQRLAAGNDGVRRTAYAHGARLVDVGSVPAMQDRRLWHEDRLHLAPEGHARVAAAVLETLGVTDPHLLAGDPGWWREPLPLGVRPPRRSDLTSDVRWVRRYLVPWLGRRLRGVSSGDYLAAKHAELIDVLPRSR